LLLAERLRRVGLPVREYPFTAQSRTALFDALLQLIRQRRLRSFPHAGLREELAGLRWVEKSGVLRPDHPASGHDDLVVATTLAAMQAAGTEHGTLTEEEFARGIITGPSHEEAASDWVRQHSLSTDPWWSD
jgi:hypothetical protein